MLKILVTGSNGQLGLSVKQLSHLYPEWQFIFTDIDELDITDPAALKNFLNDHPIDALINCAGYTAVDKAESEKEKAMLLNAESVKYLAKYSAEYGFFMIHISTDYIFKGNKTTPYSESDPPDPESVYGISKHEGEQAFQKYAHNGVIIRTSWLFSEFGTNFVNTIRRLAQERQELRVVNDQTGNPTYAGDFASCILKIISQKGKNKNVDVFHFANEGNTTWYEFAKAIVELSNFNCIVSPISTSEYPLPAKRPAFSSLNTEKIKNTLGIAIPHWKESLIKCIQNIESVT